MSTDNYVRVIRIGTYMGQDNLIDVRAYNPNGLTAARISAKDARELANQILALCDEIDTEEVMKT